MFTSSTSRGSDLSAAQYSNPVMESAIHRQIPEARYREEVNLELTRLFEIINSHAMVDSLSTSIMEWFQNFKTTSRSKELENVVHTFIEALKELLTSPIAPYPPFDGRVYLGNDGQAYGEKFLRVYLSGMRLKEGQQYLSPFSPDNEKPFYVEPHPLANEIVAWLSKPNPLWPDRNSAVSEDVELNRVYDELQAEGMLKRLPQAPRQRRHINLEERRFRLMERCRQEEQTEKKKQESLQRRLHNFSYGQEMGAQITNERLGGNSTITTTTQKIQEKTRRHHEDESIAQNQIASLLQETESFDREQQSTRQQAKALHQRIVKENLDQQKLHHHMQDIVEDRTCHEEFDKLENNLQSCQKHLQQTFQSSLAPLAQDISQTARRIDQLQNNQNISREIINDEFTDLTSKINGEHNNLTALDEKIKGLQERVNDYKLDESHTKHILNDVQEETYYREQLARLIDKIKVMRDPLKQFELKKVERAEAFLKDKDRVEKLKEATKKQLLEVQEEIGNHVMKTIEDDLESLEKQNIILQDKLHEFNTHISEEEKIQAQVNLSINNVAKMIKKQRKSRLTSLLTHVALGIASAAVTAGISYYAWEWAKCISFSVPKSPGLLGTVKFAL